MTTIPILEEELKEAYKDLKYYKNYSERLRKQLQQKENIIKEVREFVERYLKLNLEAFDTKDLLEKILKISDKGK